MAKPIYKTPLEYIKAKIRKNKNDCWIWKGPFDRNYGLSKYRSIHQRAHRFVWEILRGKIPLGLFVCHHCDNPACVNPDHLFIGTHTDNMIDRSHKRRCAKGEKHSRAKLTNRKVKNIRSLKGKIPMTEIAKKYKMSYSTINQIIRRDIWKHI